ncbi:MAG: sigma-70 family RNA polymerase sigma factor [Deltaproteobacteria bacterium]|nr:sigma-70 family RNA polymerase sigma factor [Deltaproteobacteria bacterium]MBW2562633.1 sigma-70 family RNA polymerase sigma factor [Deltaproteobacteria bacterium]
MSNFRAFYKKHREKLFGYLMRSTGDYYLSGDILQEAFTRYLEKYGEEGQNPALLYTIARNAVVDSHRKQRRDTPLLDEQEPSANNPETDMMVREDFRRVLAAMQKLEPEERDTLSLVVSSGLPYREIARISGTSEANVKVRIHRARVKLKKMINTGDI